MSLTKELEEQLKAQRDKLLDLSGTNRLVDFKFKIKENARSQNYLRIVEKDSFTREFNLYLKIYGGSTTPL